MSEEKAVTFLCDGATLLGILHPGTIDAKTGVIIVVGGPQYRAGSHRQFVQMARRISAAGVPVLRFDHRGVGDAEGDFRSFDTIDQDIRCAIDCMLAHRPSLTGVVLLGLCDAASACLMYAPADDRITGLILLNPWVRTQQGEAKAYLRHYYFQRLFQRSFWRKIISRQADLSKSLAGFWMSVRDVRATKPATQDSPVSREFLPRMLGALEVFSKPILFLISGRDLTAQEFLDLCRDNKRWRKALRRNVVVTRKLPKADHTMSGMDQLNTASTLSVEWLVSELRT